ncbi:MAG: GatB/YqeY domain-containing protein [Actinobacteria bacterium]|nr:GatB/YqeY domain-containing protein [Thermoleophilia bacterium]MCB9010251.1 GatB/YqeY domain-containing protein [Actinomycetota bacterium]
MSLIETIETDTKTAMKSGDKARVAVLRRARAAIKNAEIDARGGADLTEDDVQGVLRGLVKRHKESIDQFTAGGRDDLVEKETAEMAILEEYLPAQLDDDAIEAVVREVIAQAGVTDAKGLGKVMGPAMGRLGGQADGGRVREIAQRLLNG